MGKEFLKIMGVFAAIFFSVETLARGEWLLFIVGLLLTVIVLFLMILLKERRVQKQLGDTEKYGDITSQMKRVKTGITNQLGNIQKYGDITSQLGDTKGRGDITSQIEKAENSILKRMGSDETGSLSYQLGQLGGALKELQEEKRKIEALKKSDQELFLAADSLRNKYLEAQVENLTLRQEIIRLQQKVEQLERQLPAQREDKQPGEGESQDWDLER